jgi:hypothetical protein
MKAIIYRPSKSAMQSGLKNTKKWVLKLEAAELNINPFTGWTGSNGAQQSHLFTFDSKEQAENFAQEKNLDYETIDPQQKQVEPKSYIDNFKPC